MKNLSKSTTAKLAAGFVGFAMTVTAFVPALASADTSSDLQAQINSLLATISSLQAQLGATTGGSSMSSGYTFNTNLTVGSKGADVMNLQKVLNMSADTQVAATGAGSKGMETSTFGPATKAAVVKFQMKNGVTPASGYVGALTRGKLNSMGGGVVTNPSTPTTPGLPQGGALSVMAGMQPANSLAPTGASRVPFTNFTLTAGSNDVTVNSVTVERTGLAQDAVFAGVVLLNSDGMQIGIAKTLNSNHQAMVGEPWVVRAGTSRTYTVAGNMASSLTNYAGQVASLSVVAINTSASVTGSLPITGAMQTINASLTVGTVTVGTSSYDPNSGPSQAIGSTGYKFSGLRLTAGSAEDLTFKSIRWNQSGSASSADISNLVTVVNGTSYPTTVSADGKYYSTVFPTGIVIAKGNSVDVYIQGDITGSGAAGRSAEFDVYKNTDVYLSGNTYGYGIVPAIGSNALKSSSGTPGSHGSQINTSTNPWFQGSLMNITAGSVTLIGKANEVAAQNIAINVANQTLGGFATNFDGEPVSVQNLYFVLSTTTNNTATANSPFSAITNITVVDENGAVVAGPVDATVGDGSVHGGQTTLSSAYSLVHFSDTVTFKTGRHVYTVKGKIPSAWANGVTLNVYTKPSTDWTNVTGQTTGNSVDLSGQSTAFTMNQMTVKGAALQVNVSAQPAAQNLVGGVQNFVLANYQLDATQSGEDVRLSSFPVKIDATVLATDGSVSDLTGCQLWDGTTALNTGSRVKNTIVDTTAMTFSFDNSLTVAKGTSKTLALSCNVASSPSQATYQALADSTSGDYSLTGLTSGNSVTPTFGTGNGGLMTVQTGSFAASVDSSSFASTTVAGGTNGVNIGKIKFRATNEDVNLTKVGLKLTVGSASNIGTVYLYNAAGQQVGSVVFPQGTNPTATSTLSTAVPLARDTDVVLTIKADIAAIGTGMSGVEGAPIVINAISAEGNGLSSGNTLAIGNISTGVAGVRAFRSFPTVAQDTLSSTGVADGKLMRFKVTADSHGNISLYQLTFTLATSSFGTGGGVSSVQLFAYSDASYSQLVQTTIGASTGQFGATNGTTGGTTLTSAPTLVFRATTNALPVSAGQTVYLELKGTVSSASTGTSVTTTLLGDSAYLTSAHLFDSSTFVSSTTGAIADGARFIWSGNATSTPTIASDTDWANGFSILNLPAGGFSTTRGI